MNVVMSILTARVWGLASVAVGILCAMLYQTVWMVFYDSRHILDYSMKESAKHVIVDAAVINYFAYIEYVLKVMVNARKVIDKMKVKIHGKVQRGNDSPRFPRTCFDGRRFSHAF